MTAFKVSTASHPLRQSSFPLGYLTDLAIGLVLTVGVARLRRPAPVDARDVLTFGASIVAFWAVSFSLHRITVRDRAQSPIEMLTCSVCASALTQLLVAPLLYPMMRGAATTLAAALLPPLCTVLRLRLSGQTFPRPLTAEVVSTLRWPAVWLALLGTLMLAWVNATGRFTAYRLWVIQHLEPVAEQHWAIEPLFDQRFEEPIWLLDDPLVPGEAYVIERHGVLRRIRITDPQHPSEVVLDLRDRVGRVVFENGLFGAAFHPKLSQGKPFIYVWYTSAPAEGAVQLNVLGRFTYDLATRTFDPASELRLIEQRDRDPMHNGGGLVFGNDEMLYVGVGDEGVGNDDLGNAQRIDHNLFSGLLRIDVDCEPARSHPPPRQPTHGTTQGYCIPNDNPFVGDANALEEFWSIGLRNPYRITRHPDGVLVADVGQQETEEINLAKRGTNHGWSYREGERPFLLSPLKGKRPSPYHGMEADPVLSYPHVGRGAVIGGVVYSGSILPTLVGRYVYGDFNSGEVFATKADFNGYDVLARVPAHPGLGISSVTQVADEILITTMGVQGKANGSIYRLTTSNAAPAETPRLTAADRFARLCSSCHGPEGRPSPGSTIAARDLTDPEWQRSVSDSHIARVISEGGAAAGLQAAMPAWKGMLTAAEIQEQVQHIRSLAVAPP